LFQGALITALLVVSAGFGYLFASRGRVPVAGAAVTESDEPNAERRPDPMAEEGSLANDGVRPSRRNALPARSPSATRAPTTQTNDDPPGAATTDKAVPLAGDDLDNQVKSLPVVEGLLGQLKDRARARHDVTVDEIDPGVRAIRQLYGQLSPDEVLRKEGQFTREMAELSRQFRTARGSSGNQPTGGTE
jgi:hypothetical protein